MSSHACWPLAARTPAGRRTRRLAALAPVLLGLLACGGSDASEEGAAARAPADRPHLVLWLVDTLRADHLSTYGYERPTSPVLDGLAEEGVLFEDFHVHSNWTQPSVTSLLTGRLPVAHTGEFSDAIPPALTLAAEWLAAQGYQTAGFTVSIALAAVFGFDQGFETYEELDAAFHRQDRKDRDGRAFDAEVVVDRAVAWLDDERRAGEPFFLLLHTVDPHMPHEPHPGLASWATDASSVLDGTVDNLRAALTEGWERTAVDEQRLVDLYDGEVVYSDHQLGRLLAALEARGLREDTLVVVVSDHGEELWDRTTYGHGHENLHAELTHVPLVLSWPGGLAGGVRVPGLARGVDLLPTLLEVMGLPPLPDGDGASLAAAVRGEARPGREALYVDRARERADVRALRSEEELLVVNPHRDRRFYYDLVEDPEARRNRVADRREDAERLWAVLSGIKRRLWERADALGQEAAGVDLSEEDLERLRALGYVEG